MKKTIGILLCFLFLFLTGCGKKVNELQKVYNLGEEIKTDTLKVKLLNASYLTSIKNGTKVIDAPDNHTFVEFTFYAENVSESEIKFGGPNLARFNSFEYSGEEYEVNAVFYAISDDNTNWSDYTLDYISLLGTHKKYLKAYIDVPVKVSDFKDKINLSFYLPEGKAKYQKFTYII